MKIAVYQIEVKKKGEDKKNYLIVGWENLIIPNLIRSTGEVNYFFELGIEKKLSQDGKTDEEVIEMLIDRLKHLDTKIPSKENALAISNLQQALIYLEKRTKRGVEGNYKDTNVDVKESVFWMDDEYLKNFEFVSFGWEQKQEANDRFQLIKNIIKNNDIFIFKEKQGSW